MTKRNIVGEDMAFRMLSRPGRRDGKPLTADREQAIRDLPDLINKHCWSAAIDAGDAIRDLTAELERLRARVAELEARPAT